MDFEPTFIFTSIHHVYDHCVIIAWLIVSEPTVLGDAAERKRHISAPDESHSDSESTSVRSHHELGSTTQLMPRPRSSASLIELIDSSTAASATVEQLISDSTISATSVCTAVSLIVPSQPRRSVPLSVCTAVSLIVPSQPRRSVPLSLSDSTISATSVCTAVSPIVPSQPRRSVPLSLSDSTISATSVCTAVSL